METPKLAIGEIWLTNGESETVFGRGADAHQMFRLACLKHHTCVGCDLPGASE
jgi:hypothetical protein